MADLSPLAQFGAKFLLVVWVVLYRKSTRSKTRIGGWGYCRRQSMCERQITGYEAALSVHLIPCVGGLSELGCHSSVFEAARAHRSFFLSAGEMPWPPLFSSDDRYAFDSVSFSGDKQKHNDANLGCWNSEKRRHILCIFITFASFDVLTFFFSHLSRLNRTPHYHKTGLLHVLQ